MEKIYTEKRNENHVYFIFFYCPKSLLTTWLSGLLHTDQTQRSLENIKEKPIRDCCPFGFAGNTMTFWHHWISATVHACHVEYNKVKNHAKRISILFKIKRTGLLMILLKPPSLLLTFFLVPSRLHDDLWNRPPLRDELPGYIFFFNRIHCYITKVNFWTTCFHSSKCQNCFCNIPGIFFAPQTFISAANHFLLITAETQVVILHLQNLRLPFILALLWC